MNKITCLADAINHTPRVRVIKENDENYGKEFNIVTHNYSDKQLSITDKPGNYCVYQYSEIQFLTPVQYEWRFIGLGDKVNWYEVFDYSWSDQWWSVRIATLWSYRCIAYFTEEDIKKFEPLHKLTPKIELSTEDMVEELKRRWVVTQGNIINQ